MKIYIARPFDKGKGIMSPIHAFASADVMLDYLGREGVVSDEHGRETDREALKEYYIYDNAILKVFRDAYELMPGMAFEASTDYYHISIIDLHE